MSYYNAYIQNEIIRCTKIYTPSKTTCGFCGWKMHLVGTYFIFELLHSAACKRGGRFSHRLKTKAVPSTYRSWRHFLASL